MFPVLVYGGLTAFSGYVCYSGSQIVRRTEDKERRLLSNVVKSENLQDQPRSDETFILQHNNTTDEGVLDLYRQEIVEEIEEIPLVYLYHPYKTEKYNLSLASSVMIKKSNRIRYELNQFKKFFTSNSFGMANVSAKSYFKDLIDRANITPKQEIFNGNMTSGTLIDKYKFNVQLYNDSVYKSMFYPLKDRSLYFLGNKYADKFMYHAIGTNPERLARYEVEDRQNFGLILMVVGTLCTTGFAIATLVYARNAMREK